MPKPPPRPSLRSIEERNKLVMENLDLPRRVIISRITIVSRLFRNLGFEDAIQVGLQALIRAAELYDENKQKMKKGFGIYAARAIRRAIITEMKKVKFRPDRSLSRQFTCMSGAKVYTEWADDEEILEAKQDYRRATYSPPPSEEQINRLYKALQVLPPSAIDVVTRLAESMGSRKGTANLRSIGKELGICHETLRKRHRRWLSQIRRAYLALEELEDE